MKKTLEAGANTIEVLITDADKTNLSELRPEELRKISLNAKAVNLLHNAMCKEEYGRIKSCKTAKEIWDLLETAHVGNNQVKHTYTHLNIPALISSSLFSYSSKSVEPGCVLFNSFHIHYDHLQLPSKPSP
ncbi:hypothetical protein LIER_24566 [Lithospermum erythrorhizon]|uniref:Uncharacterized protein n=1 Tax=Lithospermum erythrorhizon TaxID=34254 RepID=A0AAV3R4M0_LITER